MSDSASSLNSKTIIFVHIPKTAGQTVAHIISGYYQPHEVFHINDRHPFEEFINLPTETRESFRFVYGHIKFGLHRYLPQPTTYITLLRNPIKRVVSQYHFALQSPDHPTYPVAKSAKNIRDYVASGVHSLTDNVQTRRLSGMGSKIPFGKCSQDHLEMAKENLDAFFSLVGTTEKFDPSIFLLSKEMGWDAPYYQRANVTRSRRKHSDFSEKELAAIHKHSHFDLELYSYAQTLLEKKIRAYGSAFEQDLKNFQSVNAEKYPTTRYKEAMTDEELLNDERFSIGDDLDLNVQDFGGDIVALQSKLSEIHQHLIQEKRKNKLLSLQRDWAFKSLKKGMHQLSNLRREMEKKDDLLELAARPWWQKLKDRVW